MRVAFEATDAYGNPVNVSGRVVDKEGRESVSFVTGHEGKGCFTYTAGEKEGRVEVSWDDKNTASICRKCGMWGLPVLSIISVRQTVCW